MRRARAHAARALFVLAAAGACLFAGWAAAAPAPTEAEVKEMIGDTLGRRKLIVKMEGAVASGIKKNPDDPAVAQLHRALGHLYQEEGNYEKARAHAESALAILEKAHAGAKDLAPVLSLLGKNATARGDFVGAERHYRRSLELTETASGPDSLEVAVAARQLGDAYQRLDAAERAEPLLRRSVRILEAAGPKQEAALATSLGSLATASDRLGDVGGAAAMLRRAISIVERLDGPEAPSVATLLNNLAVNAGRRGQRAEAYDLAVRALTIHEKQYGRDDPRILAEVVNLGAMARAKGDLPMAENLANRSVAIAEKRLGPAHPHLATALLQLGYTLRVRHDPAGAEASFRRALGIVEKSMGAEHHDTGTVCQALATLLVERGQLPEAQALFGRAAEIKERVLDNLVAGGTSERRQALVRAVADDLQTVLSFHLGARPDSAEAGRLAFTTLLRRKGRALESTVDLVRAIRERAAPEDRALLDELAALQARLASATLEGPKPGRSSKEHEAELGRTRDAARALEERLGARYAQLRSSHDPVTLEAVRATLPKKSVLVELVRYRPLDFRRAGEAGAWGQARYAAYVLAPGRPLAWKDLGEAAPIERMFKDLRRALMERAPEATRAARALDEALMRPVRPLLGDADDVRVAPDGLLNLVPFGALIDEKGEPLIKRYRFTYLVSGRELLRYGTATRWRQEPVIVGDPQFRAPAEAAPPATAPTRGLDRLARTPFERLPGTAAEATAISKLLPSARAVTGTVASEALVKELRGPRVLHLATHGFFLDEDATAEGSRGVAGLVAAPLRKKGNRPPPAPPALANAPNQGEGLFAPPEALRRENPLLLSGIVLAGARGTAGDDGFLTALEASSLDLAGTELVVLSACDTGLGRLSSGDGVQGLRSALTLAGSQTLVVSLWKVDDQATLTLMTEYYRGLVAGAGRSEALRQAQLKLLRDPKRSSPFYWAAFIASGDGRPISRERAASP